ncbi:hypothetical protein MiSe_21490 [Microseira wollei NIES-4236]|uniref:Uncharacterized protein n=1 Tax=Microseira wollei NIES-4236 TaxID=2530354 RepID=A0AAV3X7Y9_9CYAN|nr:hypothetical protein [Microseira wollei]GET37396.1 hypothetical protein MiSe_21490 [Microseira wollei NIES-4236]
MPANITKKYSNPRVQTRGSVSIKSFVNEDHSSFVSGDNSGSKLALSRLGLSNYCTSSGQTGLFVK